MAGQGHTEVSGSSWLIRLGTKVAIGLGVVYQIVVEQKLLLHTFLGRRETGHRVTSPPVGFWNVLAVKSVLLLRQITGRHDMFDTFLMSTYERMRRNLEAGRWPQGAVQEIPTYTPDDITPKEFYRRHVKTGIPAVIRNMGHPDQDQWNLDFVADKFPELKTQVLDRSVYRVITDDLPALVSRIKEGKVKPFQAALGEREARYFSMGRFDAYFGVWGKLFGSIATYLILGRKQGVNAPMHCEAGLNWYFEVSGTRRWTLVDAEYSWFLYPSSAGTGMRRFSEYLPDAEGNPADAKKYSLVKYAPRYEFELHPGDVLLHPAWMWHKTIGLEDHCLGIRYNFLSPTPMPHRYFRFLQIISPEFWKLSATYVASMLGDPVESERAKASTAYNDCEVPLWQKVDEQMQATKQNVSVG